MKKFYFALALLFASTVAGYSTTTLQFSLGTTAATAFANATGTATNGMRWGILIDSTGNGFQSGNYDSFSTASSSFLAVGGSASDDYYFFTGLSTQAIGVPFPVAERGDGGITTAVGVPSTGDGVNGVAGGDAFAIIWFQSSTAGDGDKYGIFTDPSFVLPASGTNPFTTPFAGTDTPRAASFTIGAAAVPEPSRLILLGLGFAGLIWRRKR